MFSSDSKQFKTILGRVACDPQEDVTKNGWRLLSFTVDDGKKEWPCKFIQDPDKEDGVTLLEKKAKEGLARDVTATFRGKWNGDELLVSQMFGVHIKGEKKVVTAGGREAAAKEWKKISELQKARGNVYCKDDDGRFFWHPHSDAVLVKGEYRRKIDFIMDVLGGEFVTRYLRGLGLTIMPSKAARQKYLTAKHELFMRAEAENGIQW